MSGIGLSKRELQKLNRRGPEPVGVGAALIEALGTGGPSKKVNKKTKKAKGSKKKVKKTKKAKKKQ